MKTYIQISGFDPEFGFFEAAKSVLRSSSIQQGSCVFVTSRPDEINANNERLEKFTAWLAAAGITFASTQLIDNRIFNASGELADFDPKMLLTADCIFLMSGDTQKQMDFIVRLGIDNVLKNYGGAVIGVSAGAMNMARLGIVDYHVLPHFERLPEERLRDFYLPKSFEMTLYGMNENAVIYHQQGKTQFLGDIFEIKSGEVHKRGFSFIEGK